MTDPNLVGGGGADAAFEPPQPPDGMRPVASNAGRTARQAEDVHDMKGASDFAGQMKSEAARQVY